ncbi:MAG: hypothetical protein AB1512_04480 [Thermodesulfobacteriota bacterium]
MKTKWIVTVIAFILTLGSGIAYAMCEAPAGAATGMATMGASKAMGTGEAVGPLARGGGMGGGGHGGMGGGGMSRGGMGGGGMGGGGMGHDSGTMSGPRDGGQGDMRQGPEDRSGQMHDEEMTGTHGEQSPRGGMGGPQSWAPGQRQ